VSIILRRSGLFGFSAPGTTLKFATPGPSGFPTYRRARRRDSSDISLMGFDPPSRFESAAYAPDLSIVSRSHGVPFPTTFAI